MSRRKYKQSGRYKQSLIENVPLSFLLTCSERDLTEFEMSRLASVANLRAELDATLDKLMSEQAQAGLASWLHNLDRKSLKNTLKKRENLKEGPAHASKDKPEKESWRAPGMPSFPDLVPFETPGEWAKREIRNGQRSDEEVKAPRATGPQMCKCGHHFMAHIGWKCQRCKCAGFVLCPYSRQRAWQIKKAAQVKALKEANEKRKRGSKP